MSNVTFLPSTKARTVLSFSPESTEQIEDALTQIGTDMNAILQILNEMASKGTFDHLCSAIELMAMRSGALADGITERFSGVQIRGDISEWFDLTRSGEVHHG